ncbi:MAG: SPOR domain-containing protein [Myxococcales bacterium]|jgi:cell division septation protein DedD|nr:SPOR domain-containing protein [Myxococcales bacterium]MBL0193470.1 SPOR domain-containing protein [Myxococcales bacterium]HQY64435.1 SPOR domain-containing protein [Polyangiaceae bacterium]
MEQRVKHLEQIQETDVEGGPGRGATLAFVALGGACVLFAVLALNGRGSKPDVKKSDPLGELVSQRVKAEKAKGGAAKPTDLAPSDVTFPGILSDDTAPPTALAAVKGAAPQVRDPMVAALPPPAPSVPPPGRPQTPPAAGDRLPVVPLPAANILEATPLVTRPRDPLTKAASDGAQAKVAAEGSPAAAAGHEGGFQLQVSSFRTREEGEAFAKQLRDRGHKAYVSEANVAGRGTWFRVRVGPFATQHQAAQYRTSFEDREHVVPFIIPPQK